MNNMEFLNKTIGAYVSCSYSNVSFKKPQTCPHCEVNTDATLIKHLFESYESNSDKKLLIFVWRCTVCKKLFVSFHLVQGNESTYLGIFPQKTVSYSDEYIANISPRFIEIYNQALTAENNGSIELASVGFRSSLEILIKDYAINCLNEEKEEVVKLNLNNIISKYLDDISLSNTADVIRILGNDHTHYNRKFPEHDFSLLKEYMNIFISLIRAKIMSHNPPVSR